MKTLLQALFGLNVDSRRRPRPRCALHLEFLEQREVPATLSHTWQPGSWIEPANHQELHVAFHSIFDSTEVNYNTTQSPAAQMVPDEALATNAQSQSQTQAVLSPTPEPPAPPSNSADSSAQAPLLSTASIISVGSINYLNLSGNGTPGDMISVTYEATIPQDGLIDTSASQILKDSVTGGDVMVDGQTGQWSMSAEMGSSPSSSWTPSPGTTFLLKIADTTSNVNSYWLLTIPTDASQEIQISETTASGNSIQPAAGLDVSSGSLQSGSPIQPSNDLRGQYWARSPQIQFPGESNQQGSQSPIPVMLLASSLSQSPFSSGSFTPDYFYPQTTAVVPVPASTSSDSSMPEVPLLLPLVVVQAPSSNTTEASLPLHTENVATPIVYAVDLRLIIVPELTAISLTGSPEVFVFGFVPPAQVVLAPSSNSPDVSVPVTTEVVPVPSSTPSGSSPQAPSSSTPSISNGEPNS